MKFRRKTPTIKADLGEPVKLRHSGVLRSGTYYIQSVTLDTGMGLERVTIELAREARG